MKEKKGRALAGVVGAAAGVISALAGAKATFVGHDGTVCVQRQAEEVKRRFGVEVGVADRSTRERIGAVLSSTDVALCAAKAGVQVLDPAQIADAAQLLVAADVDAVPPLGVKGLDLHANAAPLGPHGALGVGALAIGNVKYRTQAELFKQMTPSDNALRLDFRHAYALAPTLA